MPYGTASPHSQRLPHLQLDDGRKLAPRRVPDHPPHPLDDDGLRDLQARVVFTRDELDRPQHGGQASDLDEDPDVNLVGQAVRVVPASEKQEAHFA